MSCFKSLLSFAFVAVMAFPLCFSSGAAKADVFVWQNPDKGVSVSFPDRWAVMSNLNSEEILRIAGPVKVGAVEHPQCRIRVQDDNRFKMHPVSHAGDIQAAVFGRDYWDEYVLGFKDAQINGFADGGSLGRGYASYADITFDSYEHPKMIRRGIAFVSFYNSQAHVIECSVERDAYMKWVPVFMNIVKSVDFDPVSMPFKHGAYRDFYEGRSIIEGYKPVDDYIF